MAHAGLFHSLTGLCLGFALVAGGPLSASTLSPYPGQAPGLDWPTERWAEGDLPPDMDKALFSRELEKVWSQPETLRDTRAILVIHEGRLVYERYKDGFDQDTRFLSWSMVKSMTNILAGIMVRKGEMALDERARVDQWRDASDPRSRITLRHLLHMTLGQELREWDVPQVHSTTAKMLFGPFSQDTVAYAASLPAAHEPGTYWDYTSPGSALLAGLIGDRITPETEPVQRRTAIDRFIRSELTDVIGAKSFVVEYDAAGNFQGGSHAYMTARDWARFGYLLLRGGTWDGREIVTPAWLDFSRTRAPADNNGTHAAHFWIKGTPYGDQFHTYKDQAPDDVFGAHGNEGQFVMVVPSKDLVVVRLGVSNNDNRDYLGDSMSTLLASFPDR